MIKPKVKIYDDTDMLVKGVYQQLRSILTAGSEENGACHLVLAGGSTPRVFYQFLAARPIGEIDWRRINIWWGDERCVPPGNNDSNYRMASENLLDHIGIEQKNIHRMRGESDPVSEAQRYSDEIAENVPRSHSGLPVFDLILLGMGTDGHTASIFPGTVPMENQDAYCIATRHPESGQNRISLTIPVLNQARNIFFIVTGEEKSKLVKNILEGDNHMNDLPAARVRPVEGSLIWFLDKEAGRELDG